MPVKKVSPGKRWGKPGKTYSGAGAKEKAAAPLREPKANTIGSLVKMSRIKGGSK